MTEATQYAQVENGIVVNLFGWTEETTPDLGPTVRLLELKPGQEVAIGDRFDPTDGFTRDVPVHVPAPAKPRLRVTADKIRIWERTAGQPPESDQIAMLIGQILDAQGQPDLTATLPETLIELPGATGSPSLLLIRATAGQVEVSTRQGWSPSLPFTTEQSGKYDMAAMLTPYFEIAEAPIIEVLRG